MRDAVLREIATASDESVLRELLENYNVDDGFAVLLAAVRHPRCDRGLALWLFWEADEAAQHYYADPEELAEAYGSLARYEPEDYADLVAYCATLVDGLRSGAFPSGRNAFDTGFFGTDDPGLTDRQRAIRAGRTKAAQRDFEDAFLRPEPGVR